LKTSGTETRSGVAGEIVLYQGEAAKESHKQLFSLNDACYRSAGGDMIRTILAVDLNGVSRLHVSACWETMAALAVWTAGCPPIHDVLGLLKRAGVDEEELSPFVAAEVCDLFPWLYYGGRFDILRKVCNMAKAKIEANIGRKHLLVYCHLVSDETEKIVASNL
jgi:hypothetical protein